MKNTILLIGIIATLCGCGSKIISQPNFKGTASNTITQEGAWCWFADPRAIHYQNEQNTINSTYIGYIDVHGAIKATQINHITNTKNEVLIRSWFQPDDHNNPTFLVLPDERIMVFYSRHTDEACFYYRVSHEPGDITTLGSEMQLATDHNTTYPSPFILSDDPNHIYLCWRGIGWHPTIARLTLPNKEDKVTFNWGPHQIVSSMNGAPGVRPYAKYASNGKDKIYLAYTSNHPDNQSENWIYMNSINIHSHELCDIKGERLSQIGTQEPHKVDISARYKNEHPFAIVESAPLRNWIWELILDREEHPVIAMVGINEAKDSHDYYHMRWDGGKWVKTFLSNAGGHFHQSPDIEKCYSAGMAIDKNNPQVIYASVPVEGKYGIVYELMQYTVSNDGHVGSAKQLTFNSPENNIRPFAIAGLPSSASLAWMHGKYYDWIVSKQRPEGFPTAIHTNIALPQNNDSPYKGLIYQERTQHGTLRKSTIEVPPTKTFTLSMTVSFQDEASDSDLIHFAGLTYMVPQQGEPRPSITNGRSIFTSTNLLANSNSWRKENRGTNGQWYSPEKLLHFKLAITYNGSTLNTYINGLLNQSIPMHNLTLTGITKGNAGESIKDISVYDYALSQDAIKKIP